MTMTTHKYNNYEERSHYGISNKEFYKFHQKRSNIKKGQLKLINN